MYKYRIIEYKKKKHLHIYFQKILPKSYMYVGEKYVYPLKRFALYVDYYIT